jgi:transposase
MNNNTTIKKNFEEIMQKKIIEKPNFLINDASLELICCFEDENFIGYECKSKLNRTWCKECGCKISKVKDHKIAYSTHSIINGKPVILKLHKKLFYCSSCKISTIEQPIATRAYSQKTDNFINLIINDLKEQTSYSTVARRYKISVTNVIFQFDKFRNSREKQDYSKIKHIAVDEVRIIPQVGNYQFVILDHITGNIVDILQNRYGANVKAYIENNLPHIEVMSQDFWEPYKNAVKDLKQPVKIVADKFHLARFATWAFNRTRVALQKSTNLKLGKSWKLQTKSRHKLDSKSKFRVDKIVNQHPDLEVAYKAKNYFLQY